MSAALDYRAPERMSGPATPPLMLDGWLEFNQSAWGLTPHQVRCATASGEATLEATFYLNAAGKLVLPTLTPYLPLLFHPDPAGTPAKHERDWDEVAGYLAAEMRERGLRHRMSLPPGIADVRPWQRASFQASVLYTYQSDLPFDESAMRTNTRRAINRSRKQGFVCERTDNLAHLYECLVETEERQGFTHGFTLSHLQLAQSLLGHDAFRVYVVYAPDGEPVSGSIELHQPGATAIGWMAGTKTAYLRSGVASHQQRHVLDDLFEAGAERYDFAGAQIPGVAAMKAAWGARLVPYYRVDGGRLRTLVRQARNYWTFRRAGPLA